MDSIEQKLLWIACQVTGKDYRHMLRNPSKARLLILKVRAAGGYKK